MLHSQSMVERYGKYTTSLKWQLLASHCMALGGTQPRGLLALSFLASHAFEVIHCESTLESAHDYEERPRKDGERGLAQR